jgi:hypothetical protein
MLLRNVRLSSNYAVLQPRRPTLHSHRRDNLKIRTNIILYILDNFYIIEYNIQLLNHPNKYDNNVTI